MESDKHNFAGRRVVLVDDEAYITTILASKLRQAGCEVATASDGQAGLVLAIELRPDLIVTDYQMPVLSGFEMSVRLRADARTASIPIIMLTARGHHLSEAQLAQTNVRSLLAKPFSARDVVRRVAELLAGTSDTLRRAAG